MRFDPVRSRSGLDQHATLFFAVADVAPMLGDHAACEHRATHAVFDFKKVAARRVNLQNVAHPIDKKREAAADQQGDHAHFFARRYQVCCAGRG